MEYDPGGSGVPTETINGDFTTEILCVRAAKHQPIIKDNSHKCKEAPCYLSKLVYLNNYEKDAGKNIDIKKCKSSILYHNSNCEVSCNNASGTK